MSSPNEEEKVQPNIRQRNSVYDGSCYAKAKLRSQMTFTLVEQDATAVATIMCWINLNIETAPEAKLREAFDEVLEMRKFPNRKRAD